MSRIEQSGRSSLRRPKLATKGGSAPKEEEEEGKKKKKKKKKKKGVTIGSVGHRKYKLCMSACGYRDGSLRFSQ